MNTKNIARKTASKIQRTLLAVLMLTVLFSSLPTGKAAAWTISSPSGTWGRVDMTQLDLGDITQPNGTYFTVRSAGGGGLNVYRSAASTGTQVVKVVYVLEQYVLNSNGVYVWQTVVWTEQSGQLVSGGFYALMLPDVTFRLPVQYSGYFRVRYTVSWKTTSGVLLGATQIVPNQTSDYLCSYSGMRPCQSYAGYFRIGKYGTNSW
ncbi:MAG: hypothetical protein ACM3XO_04415 [Bacteroidota bacterium]